MARSPLGRTEWMKFVALFFNQEAAAEKLFDAVDRAYQRLRDRVQKVTEKPTVFSGTNYHGVWYMPGGNSYVAMFFRDAGANYLWANDQSAGSMRLSFEVVFERAREADVWVVHTSGWTRIEDAMAEDKRYESFLALRRDRTYNNNGRVNAHGGNDYWETGIAKPHEVLADLIKIFHPGLLPKHELQWYRRLATN